MAKLYLAGPEVFLPDAAAMGVRKKALCADYGFEGLYPLDGEPEGEPVEMARAIYRANLALVARADGAIFDLTPFRGVSADVGTVFELGLFVGLGKPVFAYTNDDRDLLARVAAALPLTRDTAGVWTDAAGLSVEDFGGADNLMIDACLAEQGRVVHRRRTAAEADRFRELAGFVACLREARTFFDKPSEAGRADARRATPDP